MTSNGEATVINDRYEIHRRIGRGGMADVFSARDLLLDRQVAVKVLFPEFATDANFVERFRREAQSAASLSHPNIVNVYDWGKYEGTYFIVMEEVQGRTLAGFGERRDSGLRSTGITLAPAPGAQIVAPASGRIAFAGPYRGFGRIVIIEHEGGWTSLVTGLARADVAVGQSVIAGSPLGTARSEEPRVTVELRREGEPVNPLECLG